MNKILQNSLNNVLELAGAKYEPVPDDGMDAQLASFAAAIRAGKLNLTRITFSKDANVIIFACNRDEK